MATIMAATSAKSDISWLLDALGVDINVSLAAKMGIDLH